MNSSATTPRHKRSAQPPIRRAGVKPYQPPGLWVEVSLSGGRKFIRDKGEKLYRRSMYTYWNVRLRNLPSWPSIPRPGKSASCKDNAPTPPCKPWSPSMTINSWRRPDTLPSDPEKRRQNFPEKLNFAFEWATGRPADQLRIACSKSFTTSNPRFSKTTPSGPTSSLCRGIRRDEKLDPYDHAAWTLLASIILNLDETLNRE